MQFRGVRLGSVCGLILSLSAALGCGSSSPVAPTPVLATETFTGTLSPLSERSHTFTVNYAAGYSDASFTVTALTSVADGSAKSITIGVGFGLVSVGVCTRAAQYSNPATPLNTELPTTGGAFGAGVFCVAVFDNPAAPTVTEPLNYTLSVKHY
jgi:hypothetical protein